MGKILPCREYNYLGLITDEDGKDNKDIKRRIQQGKIVVKRLSGIQRNKTISNHIKLRIYDTVTTVYLIVVGTVETK